MDGIELMASAMHAAKVHLDVCAANLANVSTQGFHRSIVHAQLTAGGIASSTSADTRQAPLRYTGRAWDLAVAGDGALVVRDARGSLRNERAASFERDDRGHLRDDSGSLLMGSFGPLTIGADASIDDRGIVREAGNTIDRLRLGGQATVRSGWVQGANVDAIHEMVDVLTAQRAFETAQKTLSALDDVRAKATSELARVKS